MKTYITIILLLTASLTYSQDWQLIIEKENESYYYKPNTDETAWIKIVSPKTEYQPNKASQASKTVDGHKLILWKYNCRTKKIGIIKSTTYSKDGKVLETFSVNDVLVEMDYVNPDSIGEGLLNIFCEHH